MSADRRPYYEELAALVAGQAERIAGLEAEVAELRRAVGVEQPELIQAALLR